MESHYSIILPLNKIKSSKPNNRLFGDFKIRSRDWTMLGPVLYHSSDFSGEDLKKWRKLRKFRK